MEQPSELIFPAVTKLKYWAKCHFCGCPRPDKAQDWKFIPFLLEDPTRGAGACPDCAPAELQKLIDAGLLIPVQKST